MTASVALLVAVDDTLHFLTSYRRSADTGQSVHESLQPAFACSGAAMVPSTVICGWGMLAFAFSAFIPTSRFAMMMTTLLLGDLVLLPALLLSPLGRVFRTSSSRSPEQGKTLKPKAKRRVRRSMRTTQRSDQS